MICAPVLTTSFEFKVVPVPFSLENNKALSKDFSLFDNIISITTFVEPEVVYDINKRLKELSALNEMTVDVVISQH